MTRLFSDKVVFVGFVIAVIIALFLSPRISSFPDALERVAEDLGFMKKAKESGTTVWGKSPLPDYKVPGVQDERWATGLAGLGGTLAVAALAWGLARLLKKGE